MEENFDINKELKEIAPFLSELEKKEEGYQVPFNYFEGLSDQIMEQVVPEPIKSVEPEAEKRPSLLDWLAGILQPQPRMALALATMVGVLCVGYYFFGGTGATNNFSNSDLLAANISAEDAKLYVQENLDEFALELLAEDETIEMDYNTVFDLNESELQDYIDEEEMLEDFEDNDLL